MNAKLISISGIGRMGAAATLCALLLAALILSLHTAAAAPLPDAPLPIFLVSKPFGDPKDQTVALAVGDMNDDGALDIVTANDDGALDIVTANDGAISYVHFNDGQGNFPLQQSAPFRPTSGRMTHIAVGAIDADGDLDIVAGIIGGQSAVYLNRGGVFTQSRPFGPPQNPFTPTIALGDVDGDADYDIVAGYLGGQSVVYLNTGGVFYTGTVDSTVCNSPSEEIRAQIRCFGAPDDPTRSIALGDLDGDGRLDIVVGNKGRQNRVYSNTLDANGAHGFFPAEHSSPFGDPNEATRQVAVGDMDGDGHLDIVAVYADSANPHRAYLNDGYGRFPVAGMILISVGAADVSPQQDEIVSAAIGDIDSDGDLDLLVGIGTDSWLNRLYYNDGQARFARLVYGYKSDQTRAVALGDFNNDGFLDLARANYRRSNTIDFNGGQGQLTPLSVTTRMIWAYNVKSGDIDGDGALDIIIGNYDNKPNLIFRNDGSGRFPAEQVRTFGDRPNTTGIALGDLDRDGRLDIIEGKENPERKENLQSRVYFNAGAGYFTDTARIRPFGPRNLRTFSVATGDINGDGSLDIVTGNLGDQNAVYLNDAQGAGQFTEALDCRDLAHVRCFGTGKDNTWSVALGDVNGDGALDIVVGNEIQQSLVYLNDGSGRFTSNRVSLFGGSTETTYSVAVGDLNSDGAPDIVAGNFYGPSRVHLNDGAGNFPEKLSAILSTGDDRTYSVALADINDDGAPDIIFGMWFQDYLRAYRGNLIYLNDGRGGFSNDRVRAFHVGDDYVRSVDVGDFDGDGAPDIVAGMRYYNPVGNQSRHSVVIYPNPIRQARGLGGAMPGISVQPVCGGSSWACVSGESATIPITYTLRGAAGLAVRRIEGWYSLADEWGWRRIVTATTATTATTPTLHAGDAGRYDWDLLASGVFGRWESVRVSLRAYPSFTPYTNGIPGPYLWPYAVATTPPFSVAGAQVKVVAPGAGASQPISNAIVYRIAPGQIRGAKALADNTGRPFRTNEFGDLGGRNQLGVSQDSLVAIWPSAAVSDHIPMRNYFSDSATSSSIPVGLNMLQTTTNVRVDQSRRIVTLTVGISLTQATGTQLVARIESPRGQKVELFKSIAYGAPRMIDVVFSDHFTETFRTLPDGSRSITGTFKPFRSLGALIPNDAMADGVWRLHLESTLLAYDPALISVGPTGTLLNLPQISPPRMRGWRLGLQESPLHYTSAEPVPNGLKAQSVQANRVQTLTISPANPHPLLLFDLDVALEWDASKDDRYRERLKADIERASEFLYDWTNGQAALGRVRVFQDAKHATDDGFEPWNDAHIRIYATNRLRPNAVMGGIVSQPYTDPLKSDIAYFPGQIQMGATWNRFGESTGNLGDDWPRALAHELGHYLFFLDDNYLGLKDGAMIPIRGCSGAMGDLYSDDEARGYGEFHARDGAWERDCRQTLSHIQTGRADWETITTFYPWLRPPQVGIGEADTTNSDALVQPGPNNLPLDVTQIDFIGPAAATTDKELYFEISNQCAVSQAGAQGRAFLIKAGNRGFIDLGAPGRDQVLARGAQTGDELYILADDGATQQRNKIGDPSFSPMRQYPGWQPDIEITGATTDTLAIKVSKRLAGITGMSAYLFPLDGAAAQTITLTSDAQDGQPIFTGAFHLERPAPVGHILIRVEDSVVTENANKRELQKRYDCVVVKAGEEDYHPIAVADYTLGGSPAWIWSRGGGAAIWSRGGGAAIWSRGGGANILSDRYAPLVSSDGQVILYGDGRQLTETLVTLQSTTALPSYPAWLKPVGRGYRLSAFNQNGSPPDLAASGLLTASLNIGYLSGDAPKGGESWIRAYYWNSAECKNWCLIDTLPDPEQNSVSVRVQGLGIYALMSSIAIPLQPGWNMFGYPVETGRTVPEALASIAGRYTIVYSYDPKAAMTSTLLGWRSFSPAAPADRINDPTLQIGQGDLRAAQASWVNDLTHMQFGQGYLIHVTGTEPITLYLAPEAQPPDQQALPALGAASLSLGSPPAIYYGVITGAPATGTTLPVTVTARRDGRLCGEVAAQRRADGELSYKLKVAAAPDCGAADAAVTLQAANGQPVTAAWDNRQMHPLTLMLAAQAPLTPTIHLDAPLTMSLEVSHTLSLTATGETLAPARTSSAADPGLACVELAHNGGFEGPDGWTLPVTQSPARILPEPAGGHVLQLGRAADEPAGRAAAGFASAHQTIHIPADATKVELGFRYRTNFASGAIGYAMLFNAGRRVELWRTTARSLEWTDVTVDLTAYRGRNVQLYFEASPGPRAGMTIDDVRVQACQ